MIKNPPYLKVYFLIITGLTLSSVTSWARDMEGRLGLGYNSEFANSTANGFRVPGISIKYALSRDVALEGIYGVSTTTHSNSVMAAKFFRNLFFEPNLNFYFMGGVGILNSNNIGGIELLTGAGVEFFLPGIESLGFSVEVGATFNNASGEYAIKTLGASFLDAGIHFYF